MKTLFSKIFVIILILFSTNITAQIRSFDDCDNVGNPANFAFQNNESITLAANYKWGLINKNVGEAKFTLNRELDDNGKILFVAKVNAKTYGFFNTFFKIHDVFESKFYAETMKPLHFNQDVHEGKYTKKSSMNFDWKHMKIYVKKQKKKKPEQNMVVPLENCMFDLITFIYYLRNIDFSALQKDDILRVKFAFDNNVQVLKVRYGGTKEVKTDIGNFNSVIAIVQTVPSETFPEGEDLYLYLSNDRNHIPLYIEMPLKIGKVRAILSEYKNLKFPLSSKISD